MKILKKTFVTAMIILFCASFATAADQTRTRGQKKDGSCRLPMSDDAGLIPGADQIRKKDRKKDGSCQLPMIDNEEIVLSADQIRKKSKKQDGSCES